MIVIKNGRVLNPADGTDRKADVLIEGDSIKDISEPDEKRIQEFQNTSDKHIIDAEDLIVAPGLVDTHVHFRDPGFTHKEDIFTGAKAAVKGGFTTVVLMANTAPPVDNVQTLTYVLVYYVLRCCHRRKH